MRRGRPKRASEATDGSAERGLLSGGKRRSANRRCISRREMLQVSSKLEKRIRMTTRANQESFQRTVRSLAQTSESTRECLHRSAGSESIYPALKRSE